MIGKPITDNMKTHCNRAYLHLKHNARYVSKQELMSVLGLNNERSVRDVISTLAKRVSIIATSDNKGYKLYMKGQDDKELQHTFYEHLSRQRNLADRDIPISKDLGIAELYLKYIELLDTMISMFSSINAK